MITLELPSQTEMVLIEKANHAGLSLEHYLIKNLEQLAKPTTRQLGGGEHFLLSNLDKFDEPLDEFKEYM